MTKDEIIKETKDYVKSCLNRESTGHDWWHVFRVWNLSKKISALEKANTFIAELAALLHDIADWKEYNGDSSVGSRIAGEWLSNFEVFPNEIESVQQIIRDMSFKGSRVPTPPLSLEGKIVQDADRLDAIGAIGIARAFSYGGNKGRLIYDPMIEPHLHKSVESYLSRNSPSINHFYEKLLLLKKEMNTECARKIADERHDFMLKYLDQFFKEWNFGITEDDVK